VFQLSGKNLTESYHTTNVQNFTSDYPR